MINRFTNKLFNFLASLKLAVVVMTGLTLSLAVATTLESLYDTPTAQYWVYRAFWFHMLLALLGVNILVVALSRLPWKKRHTPFLLAHLGILMMLFGSWLTDRYGLDGSLRLPEGQSSAVVEQDRPQLVVSDQKDVKIIPLKWQPPGVAFSPLNLKAYGLPYDVKVDQYITHAEPQYFFVASRNKGAQPMPAVELNVSGGPMRISQDMWLWTGDNGWRSFNMGPAWFAIGVNEPQHRESAPGLLVTPSADGRELSYLIRTSDGKSSKGKLKAEDITGEGKAVDPGWKGGVKLVFKKLIPAATPLANYSPSRVQSGGNAPPSAVHVISGSGGEGKEVWLGLGDRALLSADAGEIEIGYLNERVMMPFSLKLNRFQIDTNPGTNDPAAYSSKVKVEDGTEQPETLISMNEPLIYKGLTIYQASYENATSEGARPTVSIFAINRDPGRSWKYWGSILIVAGAILLFAMKYYGTKVQARKEAA